jgi:hypothetical protein
MGQLNDENRTIQTLHTRVSDNFLHILLQDLSPSSHIGKWDSDNPIESAWSNKCSENRLEGGVKTIRTRTGPSFQGNSSQQSQ